MGAGLLAAALAASLVVVLLPRQGRRRNFSQHPGFAAYFAAHPPSHSPPTVAEQELLRRFRPRLLLPAGHGDPIDFYADYIAHGRLTDGAGRLVADRVTQDILSAHKSDPRAVFVYRPSGTPPSPTVYGRVDRETVVFPTEDGPMAEPFTFLTYHAVFPVSGLPAGLPSWQELLLRPFASLDDWHQLDHFTAATIALDARLTPVALSLQQHNGLRTYLFGADVPLPADGRPPIDVALRSNELYPHVPGRSRRRAVPAPTPEGIRYLMTGRNPPFLSADDITESVAEAQYALAFLPPDDAFYTFQGYLGERRWLPGRSGPPGAEYNTLPALKPRGMQMLAFYWRGGDAGDLARFEESLAGGGGLAAFARAQGPIFYRTWRCAREGRSACGGPPGPR